ncbi:CarD family transcriptional regulator [Lachnotalea sp. AF33-28]|uniref:CarD family transcriptional regulator n=1 Tax=Lachnotalea sp. AF33-28 TaxID=2292046 RepID=UPI001FAB095B|nr:CarD family transcriptional regulator [Lachnotalea sp. AF33-28]
MNMFQKGDFVVYGTVGVCRVEDITTLDMEGVSRDKLYYMLHPWYKENSTVYTPVDNEKAVIRSVLDRETALNLIEEIPALECFETDNDKQREEEYKKALKSCQCREWVRLIKTSYLRAMDRIAQGKKTTMVDDKYFKKAEEELYDELSVSLGIPVDRVKEYIQDRIEGKLIK